MYKVIIVDDEHSVINSLLSMVDWEKLNLKVVSYFTKAEEALAYMKQNKVDILISDIRMNGIGGLELCRQTSINYPNTQIIIMSGYAEFSYAQKSLHYGVLAYCLKPIEYDELCKYLTFAISRLKNNSKNFNEDDFLDSLQQKNADEIKLYLNSKNLNTNSIYLCISVGNSIPINFSQISQAVKIGENEWCYLSNVPFSISPNTTNNSNTFSGISISDNPIDVHNLINSIHHYKSLAYSFFINPRDKVVHSTKKDKSHTILQQIARLVAVGNKMKINEILQDLLNCNYEEIFTPISALRLYNIFSLSEIGDCNYFEDLGIIYSLNMLTKKYPDFKNMVESIIGIGNSFDDLHINTPLLNSTFINMMQYIEDNYQNDISLSDISSQLHLNSNYLSQAFKKETGVNFTRYLTELRIRKAQELLVSDCYSIGEIAGKVGFNDYFYFLKTFKRITGKTPKQYRLGS